MHQKVLVLPYAFKNTTDHYGRFEEHKDSDENSAVDFVKRTLMKTKKPKHPRLKFEASKDKINVEFKEELSKHRLSYVKQSRSNNITNSDMMYTRLEADLLYAINQNL